MKEKKVQLSSPEFYTCVSLNNVTRGKDSRWDIQWGKVPASVVSENT